METNLSCAERVDQHLEGRLSDLKKLWAKECGESPEVEYDEEGNEVEAEEDDLGELNEYGLCFDYVAPQTFSDQDEGFHRYQLSTGGPGDEFRIFAQKINEYDWHVYRIEYWFLDWYDGAHRILSGEDRELIASIFGWFAECGTATAVYDTAMEGYEPPANEDDQEEDEEDYEEDTEE